MWQNQTPRVVEKLVDKLRKSDTNGTAIYKFLAFLELSKFLGHFCFFEYTLKRTVVGCPWMKAGITSFEVTLIKTQLIPEITLFGELSTDHRKEVHRFLVTRSRVTNPCERLRNLRGYRIPGTGVPKQPTVLLTPFHLPSHQFDEK